MTDLNNAEDRLADDLVRLHDMASRVLVSAEPGSRYQWDKCRQLIEAAEGLRRRLGGDEYVPPTEPVDPAKVTAAVAADSQHYAIGKALYGDRKTHVTMPLPAPVPEGVLVVDTDPPTDQGKRVGDVIGLPNFKR